MPPNKLRMPVTWPWPWDPPHTPQDQKRLVLNHQLLLVARHRWLAGPAVVSLPNGQSWCPSIHGEEDPESKHMVFDLEIIHGKPLS